MPQASVPHDSVRALMPHTPVAPIAGASGGPLAGLSFTVKDMFAVRGLKRSNGNADFYAQAEPAATNAAAVQSLLDASASLTGITVCDEFFYSLLGGNAHYGNPINPATPGRVTGGSSCGAAAAVAAGMSDFALGGDTGGSIRVPASFCGLYGLRPSHGRIGLQGATLLAPSYDTVGFLARAPDLMARIGAVLLDERSVPAGTRRLILAEDLFALAGREIGHAVKNAITRMIRRLPTPEGMTVAGESLEDWAEAFRVIQAAEIQTTVLPVIRERNLRLGPGIKERFAMAEAVTEAELRQALPVRHAASARLREIVTPGTVLAFPTAPTLPPRQGTIDGSPETEAFRKLTMQATCLAGHAGLPQLSIPACELAGCPVGLSFIGWQGGDEALLALAVVLGAEPGPARQMSGRRL
jgi:amidase